MQAEVFQTWGGSTQERAGDEWHVMVIRPDYQTCQLWEWLLHWCKQYFPIRTPDAYEDDLTDTIAALEPRNNVVHASCFVATAAPNDKEQGWPDIQHVPRRCNFLASKLQV
jgi:hypothetical protein